MDHLGMCTEGHSRFRSSDGIAEIYPIIVIQFVLVNKGFDVLFYLSIAIAGGADICPSVV